MNRTTLTEARPVVFTEAINAESGTFEIQIISPGVGSSAAYPAEVLEAAAKAGVFAAGTHLYLDHPTPTEEAERPVRSVRDLAGALVENATWNGRALVGKARVYSAYRPLLAEAAQDIGMSIRATATVEEGEFEGRRMPIVSELHEALSVDFVTRAGRGGAVLAVLESARRVTEDTANDRREALSTVVRDQYGAEKSWVWVRDWDDTRVWFEHETPDETGTWEQAYSVDADGNVSLTGERQEVRARTEYVPIKPAEEAAASSTRAPGGKHSVPVHPAGQSTPPKEHTMPEIEEGAKVSVTETRLRQLETDAGRVPLLESERDTARTERDEARHDLAVEKAKTYAREFGTNRVKESNSELDPAAVEKIVADAMRGDLPLTEAEKAADRRLDTDAFGTRVDEAQKAMETFLATVVQSRGGHVRGLGESTTKADVTREDSQMAIDEAFGRKPAAATAKGA